MNTIGLDILIDNTFQAIDQWYDEEKIEINNSTTQRAIKKDKLRSKRNEMEQELHYILREFTTYSDMNPYKLDDGLNDDDKERLLEEI